MWGNPRPGYTRCASDARFGVFRCDTAVTTKTIAPHESHDTRPRRAEELAPGLPRRAALGRHGRRPDSAVPPIPAVAITSIHDPGHAIAGRVRQFLATQRGRPPTCERAPEAHAAQRAPHSRPTQEIAGTEPQP